MRVRCDAGKTRHRNHQGVEEAQATLLQVPYSVALNVLGILNVLNLSGKLSNLGIKKSFPHVGMTHTSKYMIK